MQYLKFHGKLQSTHSSRRAHHPSPIVEAISLRVRFPNGSFSDHVELVATNEYSDYRLLNWQMPREVIS